MLASQSQNGSSETWTLDPTLGRFATYTEGGVTFTNRYSDTTNDPAWTSASTGGWQRNTFTLDVPDLAITSPAGGDVIALTDGKYMQPQPASGQRAPASKQAPAGVRDHRVHGSCQRQRRVGRALRWHLERGRAGHGPREPDAHRDVQ
jgi:hypothetical protein